MCKAVKPLSDYNRSPTTVDGKQSRCKACCKEV